MVHQRRDSVTRTELLTALDCPALSAGSAARWTRFWSPCRRWPSLSGAAIRSASMALRLSWASPGLGRFVPALIALRSSRFLGTVRVPLDRSSALATRAASTANAKRSRSSLLEWAGPDKVASNYRFNATGRGGEGHRRHMLASGQNTAKVKPSAVPRGSHRCGTPGRSARWHEP